MKQAFAISTASSLLLSTVAAAQHVHESDVQLTVDDGRIVLNDSVFGADFGEDFPNFTSDPGFSGLAGTFTPGTAIGFNILDAIRKWDDAGHFDTIATETISITYGPSSVTTPTLAGQFVPGFSLNVTGDGGFHQHLGYTLDSPASDGVYLLKLELFSTDSNLANSDPFYLVFNQNVDEAIHDDAIHYVESHIVPEPGSMALLIVGAGALMRRRRR